MDNESGEAVVLQRIADAISRHRMFAPGNRVGVAVSGGADSVFLLHALRELAPAWNLRLSVLHLDHCLRPDSPADAEFVAAMAAEFGFEFHGARVAVAAESGNLEQAAREARYAFFRGFLSSGALDRVALGHTRNDQAETVLFRFLRGSGAAGLAGIRPVTAEGIVRPLLEITRPEIESWLLERGIGWREDSTNRDPAFARNRIRHELLPQLARDWNPALGETLARTAEWARAEEQYWEAELDRLTAGRLTEKQGALLLETGWLRELPLAAARRVIRLVIKRAKGDLRGIDFLHAEAVLALAAAAEGHGRVQIPGLDVLRSFEWLRVARPGDFALENRNYCYPLPVPGRVVLPDSSVLAVQIVDTKDTRGIFDSVYYNDDVGLLDGSRAAGSLEVRNWRPGDQYQPAGYKGDVRLKALFQEGRVPLWERRHWPVVTSGERILWTRRFGTSVPDRATPDSSTVLVIRHAEE